jgi:RHS repeat-associated protein
VSFAYDLNGNLTSDGSDTYTWNARDELTAIGGSTSATFAYDALGRRRAKTVSGTTTDFLYDGWSLVQELSGGSPTANLLGGTGIDEILTRTDGTGTMSFLADPLGSNVALADSNGTVQTSYTYDPFGQATVTGAATNNSVTFTGRESDGTGLMFYRARYYDPRRQRFLEGDPVGFGGGSVNLYTYVNNRPTMLTDPTGKNPLIVLPVVGCIAGGIGAGAMSGWSARKMALGCAVGALIGLGAGAGLAGEAVAEGTAAAEGTGTAAAEGDAAAAEAQASQSSAQNLSSKIVRQMEQRGWTQDLIEEAKASGQRVPTTNYANGNPATRYISPTTGQSVVIDDVTGDVIHVGGPGFKYPGGGL